MESAKSSISLLNDQREACCHCGGMQSDTLDPSVTSPLYILSKSNSCLHQQHPYGAEQSDPKMLQERPILHVKYQRLINVVCFSRCG